MPIGYLDMPTGADTDRKRELMAAMYGALHEAWPFPDYVRIFMGCNADAKRKVLQTISSAVAVAYQLPDFMAFLVEYPLDLVAHEGNLLAYNEKRVEDQRQVYS